MSTEPHFIPHWGKRALGQIWIYPAIHFFPAINCRFLLFMHLKNMAGCVQTFISSLTFSPKIYWICLQKALNVHTKTIYSNMLICLHLICVVSKSRYPVLGVFLVCTVLVVLSIKSQFIAKPDKYISLVIFWNSQMLYFCFCTAFYFRS